MTDKVLGWTDYPFKSLGDKVYREAPIRPCEVLSYDGDKYVTILVAGMKEEVKAGYVYETAGRFGQAKAISQDVLEKLYPYERSDKWPYVKRKEESK